MGEAKRRMEMGNYPNLNLKPGQPQQIQVDITNAPPKICGCGCKFFIPVVQCFTVSALLSPTGQELTAQQPILICLECKTPLGQEKKESN